MVSLTLAVLRDPDTKSILQLTDLGLYYFSLSLLFGVSGTLWSMIIRLELYSSGNRIIPKENQNFYNLSFTLHGLFMIFFLVIFLHPFHCDFLAKDILG